jgi:hypothetical protein
MRREREGGEERGRIVKYLFGFFGSGVLVRLLEVSSIVKGFPR